METTERADDWLLGALTVRFWREQFACLSKSQMRPKSQAEVFIGVASQHCVASFLIAVLESKSQTEILCKLFCNSQLNAWNQDLGELSKLSIGSSMIWKC